MKIGTKWRSQRWKVKDCVDYYVNIKDSTIYSRQFIQSTNGILYNLHGSISGKIQPIKEPSWTMLPRNSVSWNYTRSIVEYIEIVLETLSQPCSRRSSWSAATRLRQSLQYNPNLSLCDNDKDITKLEEWYNVRNADIRNLGGSRLLSYYGDSLRKALKSLYPEHNWNTLHFTKRSSGVWKDKENVNRFLTDMASKMNIQTTKDWHFVTKE
jgi:hypothetical protein